HRIKVKFINREELNALTSEAGSNTILIFMPVVSSETIHNEKWLDETWEVMHLLKENGAGANIFRLQKDVLASSEEPEWLGGFRKFDFTIKEELDDLSISGKRKAERFIRGFVFRIFDVAQEIERIVLSKGNTEIKEFDSHRSVFLAESGSDMEYAHHVIKRELIRHGYKVYPDKPYPVNFKELSLQTEQDIRNCSLTIHLIGSSYLKPRDGKEVSLAEFQNRKAAEIVKEIQETVHHFETPILKRIIWMPENLKDTSERQRKWINELIKNEQLQAGADIIKCPLEEFKDLIFDKLRIIQKGDLHTQNPEASEGKKGKIYLISADGHSEEVSSLKELLAKENYELLTVDRLGTQEEIMNAHKNNLINCSGVIFMPGNNNIKWLRSKISDMVKMTEFRENKEYALKAVISKKIERLPSDPVFKKVVLINEYDGALESEAIRPIIEQLN
ncbi:MAG: hypothetical protein ACK4ND_16135, partial [Cytophagaceae bacterium]